MKIRIGHIDKIEGHLGFEAELFDGNIKAAFLDVLEGARMIEGIVRGRYYEDIPIITSRICGVCPVVHNLASIKALESALGVKVDKIITLFRKLMLLGELIQSHMLHVFLLSAPDFLGDTNDLDVVKKFPREAEAAFFVRDFGTKIMKIVGGRAVHPIASEVGGFKILPEKRELEEILVQADKVMSAALVIHGLIGKIKFPKLDAGLRPVSLSNAGEYEYYEGDVISGQGLRLSMPKFYSSIEELQRPKSPVKETEMYKRHYLVGALARILNQGDFLNDTAKKALKKMPVEKLRANPFYNLPSQSIEILHFIEEVKKIIKQLLALNIPRESRQKIVLRKGEGIGAVEAPRGLLLHYYKLDATGRVADSNIITPTAQFLNDLEHSLAAYLPQIKDLPPDARVQKIKSLVRAYDPCISCATH